MTTNVQVGEVQQDFARAFGEELSRHLQAKGMGPTAAAVLFGLKDKHGKPNKALINSYCHDKKDGTRPRPSAEVLYLACTKLDGFSFDYRGYRISAASLAGRTKKERKVEQSEFKFDRQFSLTDNSGQVKVRVRRPVNRIEVSVDLEAKAS